jgi:hypothetical protein
VAASEDRAEVRVVVPAAPAYVRLLRLAAADVGARTGLSLEEIDDLRVAVDELCFTLTGQDGVVGELDVTFELGSGEVVVRGVGRFDPAFLSSDRVGPPAEISKEILRAVVDEHEIEREGHSPVFRAVKRRAAT